MIETERLHLRPLKRVDASDLYEYHGDAEVVRYTPWNQRSFTDVEAVIDYYKSLPLALVDEGDAMVLGWELKSTGQVIGQSNASLLSIVDQTADLGWVINRSFWRQGYAFEATSALISHLKGHSLVKRFVATIDLRNPESARLAEKLGMRLEGVFKKSSYIKGEWCDTWLYACLK